MNKAIVIDKRNDEGHVGKAGGFRPTSIEELNCVAIEEKFYTSVFKHGHIRHILYVRR